MTSASPLKHVACVSLALASLTAAASASSGDANGVDRMLPDQAVDAMPQARRVVMLPTPRFLEAIDLAPLQRERILPILVELAPQVRALEDGIRACQDALNKIAVAQDFDQDLARQLAVETGRSVATLALLRARAEHRIIANLTEVQRLKVGALRRGEMSDDRRALDAIELAPESRPAP